MTIINHYQIFQNRQKLNLIIIIYISISIFTNVLLDFLLTIFNNRSFYISESLLFSSYWILFLPLLIFLFSKLRNNQKLKLKLFYIVLATSLHLFSYPAMVWLISKIFYYHTFDYWQTFNFTLSAYFIKTIIIYGFSSTIFIYSSNKNELFQNKAEDKEEKRNKGHLNSILISDASNIKMFLKVSDILYFSANSPYINIYHSTKKYLHAETLKNLEKQLNDNQFIRIHKSTIVNIHKVLFIYSRQNGDYDITLSDNSILRVSRNYAKNFKSKLIKHTHLDID